MYCDLSEGSSEFVYDGRNNLVEMYCAEKITEGNDSICIG